MANPQTENGFTRIANEILEQVTQYKFNGTQYKIIMVVWRYTYGFNRSQHEISNSFFAEATGSNLKTIKKELTRLIEDLVITEVKPATFKSGKVLAFNKNYEQWKVERSIVLVGVNEGGGGQLPPSMPIAPQGSDKPPGEGVSCPPGEGVNCPPKKERFKESIKESNNNDNDKQEQPINAFGFYQQNFGLLTPHIGQELGAWIDDLNEPLVIAAMKKTLEHNKRSWAYIKGILLEWDRNNVRTLEQVEALDLEFKNRTSQGGAKQYGKHEQIDEKFTGEWATAIEKRKNTKPKF